MSTRVTIVLGDDNAEKIRIHQANIIRKSKANCSFSNVVNLVLEKGLKGFTS